jgi:alkylation response protein AidB-like acyl-CoA dehydrogenase
LVTYADSETQKLLRDTARSYLKDKYPVERLYALEDGHAELNSADLREFADLGWLGLLAPESAGGGALSLLEASVVAEEIGYAGVPAPVTVSNVAATLLSGVNGADGHLLDLVAGRKLYTVSETARRGYRGQSPLTGGSGGVPPICISPGGGEGSDTNIAGTTSSVPFGMQADYVIAPAGEAVVLVSLEGAERTPVQHTDRGGFADIPLDGAAVALTLASGDSARVLEERIDALTTALSLMELSGMLQRVMEMTAEYISNRVQFGQPIAKFQAARHHAADILMQAQSTRWAAYHAIWQYERSGDASEIWLAKHYAIRASQKVYEWTHLLHGGIGVGMEYPLHLYTQGLTGFSARNGSINEMIGRTLDGLGLKISAR